MREIGDDQLERWKSTFAKDGIIYDNDDDYREAITNLVGFFEILLEINQNIPNSTSTVDKGSLHVLDKDGNKVIL